MRTLLLTAATLVVLGTSTLAFTNKQPPVPNCAVLGDPELEDVYSLCPNGVAYWHMHAYWWYWEKPAIVTMTNGWEWYRDGNFWRYGSRIIHCTATKCGE